MRGMLSSELIRHNVYPRLLNLQGVLRLTPTEQHSTIVPYNTRLYFKKSKILWLTQILNLKGLIAERKMLEANCPTWR